MATPAFPFSCRCNFANTSRREADVDKASEEALGNADVVAGKNQNGGVERIDFFGAGARSAQIHLVLVSAIGESAGACHRIHHGQAKAIRIFATLPDFAENVIRSV